ncbi:GNAT family N-acetyltransferase [Rhodococcus sp. NPDC058521]|uniref:GNAT family N-acetyltransferase n=1 Tax=Rhodococcus sp. NPDC058521 TaxID=3346536 RepID=UPI0036675C49
MIRLAKPTDLPLLQQIEVAAGTPFRDIGMSAIADDPPPSLAELSEYLDADHIWVATDGNDDPVAYALMEVVDGAAHIEQVSVHPKHSRRGLGAHLIDEIDAWAAGHHLPALTLTTFADVPWNAPYYERLGFHRLADDDVTPRLARIREDEARHGLDAWPRVTMCRAVSNQGRASQF